MSIELAKEQFINLKKTAVKSIESAGLGNQKAKVALALDISASMSGLFSSGRVQQVVEKLLALGIKFDDDQAIDIFLFGVNDHYAGELKESEFYQYVQNKITSQYRLEYGTNYAGVMQRIMKHYVGSNDKKSGVFGKLFSKSEASTVLDEPVFVIFITDGDNGDKSKTEEIVRDASNKGVFWQFVGVGYESFSFLQKLDDLKGRFLDNADFFQLNDINKVSDEDLFNRLLTEFPAWIKEARNKNLIK